LHEAGEYIIRDTLIAEVFAEEVDIWQYPKLQNDRGDPNFNLKFEIIFEIEMSSVSTYDWIDFQFTMHDSMFACMHVSLNSFSHQFRNVTSLNILLSATRYIYKLRKERRGREAINGLRLFLDEHGSALWSCDGPLRHLQYKYTSAADIMARADTRRPMFTS
jgi:hypothetical protein